MADYHYVTTWRIKAPIERVDGHGIAPHGFWPDAVSFPGCAWCVPEVI
jgi:hypothetical protein